MSLKNKLTDIIERLEGISSLPEGDSKNEELQDIYNYIILVQQDNEEPLFVEEELKKLFTEDEKTNYISSIQPLILDEQMENSQIRLLKKTLKAICNRL